MTNIKHQQVTFSHDLIEMKNGAHVVITSTQVNIFPDLAAYNAYIAELLGQESVITYDFINVDTDDQTASIVSGGVIINNQSISL